jgi:hypothetical protein
MAYLKAYRQANAEKIKAYHKAYYQANAEKRKAYDKAYYQANAEKIKAYLKAYYQANAEKRKAYDKAYRQANAEKKKAYRKAYYQANVEKIKAYLKAYYQKIKETILSHYSGGIPKCACCGEQNMAFLSIDHIEGGGTKQIRRLQLEGTMLYSWLKNNGYPSGYRVLCMNCNFSLGLRRYCPHGVLPDGQKSRPEQSQSYDAAYHKKHNQKLRHDILVHYSGGLPACSCCGEKHDEFLTIDHINGGGTDHRRMGIKGGYATYRWLIKNNFPPGFQILCMNCNFAKGHNSDGCPHKKSAEPQRLNQSADNSSVSPSSSSSSPTGSKSTLVSVDKNQPNSLQPKITC